MTGKMFAYVCCCMMLCGGVFTEATSALEKTSSTESKETVSTDDGRIRELISELDGLTARMNQIMAYWKNSALQLHQSTTANPNNQKLHEPRMLQYIKFIKQWKERIADCEEVKKSLSGILKSPTKKNVATAEETVKKMISKYQSAVEAFELANIKSQTDDESQQRLQSPASTPLSDISKQNVGKIYRPQIHRPT
ncbi:MAG: hypothetical protein LBO73_02235 [Holosporaceae bacterium]|jgi:DNA-binding transcriptional MerR regulator|nr:hypothetical protein [Holosporaceae bacterium]